MSLASSLDAPGRTSGTSGLSSANWVGNNGISMGLSSQCRPEPGSISMNPRLPDSAASRPFFLDVGMSQASSNGLLPLAFSSSHGFPPSVDQSRQSQLSARQQALYRVLKMKGFPTSPLSPQESSVLSDAGSILSQNVESIRFSATDGCVQSPLAFHKKNNVHCGQDHVANSFHRDLQLSELPIVCGPAAFQVSGGDNRAWSLSDCGRNTRIGGDPLVGLFHVEDKESKRLKRTFEDLERELLEDDADIPSSSVSTYSNAQAESCVKTDALERDWADYIEDLLAESSNSVPISTVCSTSPASDELSTDRIYTEVGVSLANAKNPFGNGLTNSLTQKQTTSLDASGESVSGPKQLLVACSSAIAESNIDLAKSIVVELKQMVNYYGEPQQRVAAYMLDALVFRMDGTNQCLYRALSATDLFSATQILYESPCMKSGYMAANRAIAEACKDADRVHIVDFEIGQGSQWISLIGLLAARQGGPPEVRITGVTDPELDSTPAGGLKYVGKLLEDVATSKGMLFRFNGVAKKVLDMQPSMLETRAGEALAVNFAFQLHRIPDESVCTTNPRDWLLRLVRSMEPKVVTLVERQANTNTAPFLPRFHETLSYYGALFESLDAWLPRENRDRFNIEQHILARDIVNIVACEGAERVERYEPAGKWRARMTMAGFRPWPLSPLLQKCSSHYRLREEAGVLYVGWKDRDLIVASAWQ